MVGRAGSSLPSRQPAVTRMLSQPKPLPPAAELWARYSYNPLTGELFSRRQSYKTTPIGRTQRGYIRVNMPWAEQSSSAPAHRVIWKWITGKDPEMSIDHKDRNKLNNRFWNLREATPSDQVRNRDYAVLTVTQVSLIKARLVRGERQRHLAKEFGVSPTVVHAIAKGRNWANVA